MTSMLALHRAIRVLQGATTTLVLLLAVSCRAVSPDSPAAGTSIVDVRGSWQKMDDRLPPIALDITEGRTALLARLSLSGVQMDGELTGTPQHLVLRFPSSAGERTMTATVVSLTEMRLQMAPGGETYTLRKVQ
jgi:hypothetical protein